MTVRIRQKGQITLPAEIREAAQLDEGDELAVSVQGCEIVLRPANGNGNGNGGASVLSGDLQERLERALADVEAGRVTRYEDDDAFLDSF